MAVLNSCCGRRRPRERLAEGKVGIAVADERLQVVMGTHRYAVFHGWNRVPLGHVSQLAVDTAGRVYVFQRTGTPIVVLTPDGDLAASWDAAPINDPHGIFITSMTGSCWSTGTRTRF
jgi:hypothetical protein